MKRSKFKSGATKTHAESGWLSSFLFETSACVRFLPAVLVVSSSLRLRERGGAECLTRPSLTEGRN